MWKIGDDKARCLSRPCESQGSFVGSRSLRVRLRYLRMARQGGASGRLQVTGKKQIPSLALAGFTGSERLGMTMLFMDGLLTQR